MRTPVLKHWPIILVTSLIAFGIVVIGALFFARARDVMQAEIKTRLQTIATAAALSIDDELLQSIQGPLDMDMPEFERIVRDLRRIQDLPDIRFAYILRKTDNPLLLEFVADADALRTDRELDDNGNGRVDREEKPGYPGELFAIAEHELLQGAAFSVFAPIRKKGGEPADAVLGVDMEADDFTAIAQSIFSPLALLIVFAVALFLAGFVAVYVEERQMRVLRKINTERSGLLRLTFHQIGEPLTILKWSLETLRSQIESPDLRTHVEEQVLGMEEGLKRLNGIIDTLQLSEKIDLNALQYVGVSVSLRAVVESAVSEWTARTAERGQRIVTETGENDVTLSLDVPLIHMALRQLLMNAVDYSADHAVILLRVVLERHAVTISVEDHGCGIPKADQKRLFQKYHRADNAHLKKPDGNGLGLFIVKGIVEKAGGRIWVKSTEGEGTVVTFTLPLE